MTWATMIKKHLSGPKTDQWPLKKPILPNTAFLFRGTRTIGGVAEATFWKVSAPENSSIRLSDA
ncbi:hypothetical protein N7523_001602 [Penicillium sp. IBT 18751x]|nr:hypothetical protein N7523_001602 [Penicillium sp. IBT 18751x]